MHLFTLQVFTYLARLALIQFLVGKITASMFFGTALMQQNALHVQKEYTQRQ